MKVTNDKTQLIVSVSISDSSDIEDFGLGDDHLREAMSEFALYILSSGMNLAYGGDLRNDGFTELLIELQSRYRQYSEPPRLARVTSYFAWPVHICIPIGELKRLYSKFGRQIQFILLDSEGGRMSIDARQEIIPWKPSQDEWTNGLTKMRDIMCNETDARILIGGRVEGYKGRMPGIAEEALLSFQKKQALYILGGYGGCARNIVKKIGIVDLVEKVSSDWAGQEQFENFTANDLNNGLSLEENQVLAQTPFIDQAVALVLHGLRQLQSKTLT